MQEKRQTVPIIFDYGDMRLRLRLPVKRPDDPFMGTAGLSLPISRLL